MFKKILIIILLLYMFTSCSSSSNLIIDIPEQPEEIEENLNIIIDIKGAIKIPGLYSVNKGSMLYEIINLAGGLLSVADINSLNLIQTFNTNSSINIPFKNDTQITKLININTASLFELTSLSGIGEAKAMAIIEYRKTNYFNSIEDIMKVSGISESLFNKIKDDITV